MNILRFCLKPRSPWSMRLRSDTLAGLLLWRLAEKQGTDSLHDALADFAGGRPPFVVSSVFPAHLLPMPCLPPLAVPDLLRHMKEFRMGADVNDAKFELLQGYKKFRKKAWLPLKIWRKYRENLSMLNIFREYWQDEKQFEFGQIKASPLPHAAINRASGCVESLFFEQKRFYDKDSVLHLYAQASDPSLLKELLVLAGKMGFGRNASTGSGQFEVELDEAFKYEEEGKGPYQYLLSTLSATDMSGLRGWYKIATKSGKTWGMANPFKAPFLYIEEGAVLSGLPSGYVLDHINANPHVAQVLMPFTLSCNCGEGKQ